MDNLSIMTNLYGCSNLVLLVLWPRITEQGIAELYHPLNIHHLIYTKKNLISKILVDFDLVFPSYALHVMPLNKLSLKSGQIQLSFFLVYTLLFLQSSLLKQILLKLVNCLDVS